MKRNNITSADIACCPIITCVTSAGINSRSGVRARGIGRAIRGIEGTIVDGGTAGAVATIASVAGTGVSTRASVATGSVSRAVVT